MKLVTITYHLDEGPHGACEVQLANVGDPDMEATVTICRYHDGSCESIELTASELFAAANIAQEHGLKGEVPTLPKTQRLDALRDRLMSMMANGPGPVTEADKAAGDEEVAS